MMMMQKIEKAPVSGAQRLDIVQMMRALAAIMIVALHAQVNWEFSLVPLHLLRLGAGVDLFFVISGFVIVYASRPYFAAEGGRSAFLVRRLLRILPLYWFVLTMRLAMAAVAVLLTAKAFPSLQAVLTSYLFIPYDSMGYGDAYPFPIIDLGWTLNYEMFFYVVFAVFIFLPLERAVLTTATVLLAAVLIGSTFNLALPFSFWFQPIILEFVAGMLLAVLFLRGVRLPPLLGIAVALCGVAIWTLIDLKRFEFQCNPGCYSYTRLLVFGGGAIFLMAAATLTRGISCPVSRSRWRSLAILPTRSTCCIRSFFGDFWLLPVASPGRRSGKTSSISSSSPAPSPSPTHFTASSKCRRQRGFVTG